MLETQFLLRCVLLSFIGYICSEKQCEKGMGEVMVSSMMGGKTPYLLCNAAASKLTRIPKEPS